MEELRLEKIGKSFAGRQILEDVSLTVEKGDIYGILGLSGAGKSTLLRLMNGLERIDEGAIYFKGSLLADKDHPVPRAARRQIAMIFQSFNLLQQATAQENVELALEIGGEGDRKEKSLAALRRVGLEGKASSYPSELSGGEQQRVAIARALALRPEVLLSDEATSALDAENADQILSLLTGLNKEMGLTIIMVSHQLAAIEATCGKVALLDKNRIIEQGELSEVFLNPKTDLAKSLIYAGKVKTLLDDKKMLRLIFEGNIDEPVIANIVEDCSILVSIVYADTKVIAGRMYGQTLIKLPQKPSDVARLERYLDLRGIRHEEVEER